MPHLNLTADAILTALSAGLSLFFAYVPAAADWYDKLDKRYKPLLMAGIIAGVILFRLVVDTCHFSQPCVESNLQEAGLLFLACLTANNMTYQHAVRQFKADPAQPAPAPVEKQ